MKVAKSLMVVLVLVIIALTACCAQIFSDVTINKVS
jgi:hypothetical protein